MKKILTIVLDGFGYREEEHGNAIKSANMEFFNKLWNEYPHSLLYASEEPVGLHKGQFGNSETGHQTIGAGRLIKQNETIVDDFFKSDISSNERIKELLENKDKRIHIMGLCSDGNVHAGIDDILNMYNFLADNEFKNIYFHVITDGRDTGINESYKYIEQINNSISEKGVGSIATICGRFYAMDRDKNYDRTKTYYELVTRGFGYETNKVKEIIEAMYRKNITDEYIKPVLVNRDGLIKNGDILIWMNYRADRAKQIIDSFVNEDFEGFRTHDTSEIQVYSLLPIDNNIKTNNILEYQEINNPLGIYLSKLGLTQARIAETEKYAHVTYFFDGGYSGKLAKCNTYNIPSKKTSSYAEIPEMSALEVTKKCVECMNQDYDFIFMNYANTDMVGHTGSFSATIKTCKVIDMCLKKVVEMANENFYKVIILADHGNADIMLDENDNVVTTHTLSKVPFIVLDNSVSLKKEGNLTMVAPTILDYMDISIPEEMKESGSLLD